MKYIVIWHKDEEELENLFIEVPSSDLTTLHCEIKKYVEAYLAADGVPHHEWYIDLTIRVPDDTDMSKIVVDQW